MKILVSLCCISNIVRFKFQIQTLLFYSNHAVWHLCGNSISCIQVSPTKFSFVKITSRRNFGEFIGFFRRFKSLLKFIKNSNIESVPRCLTLFLFGISSPHNCESCSQYSNLSSCKNWEFLEQGKASILILQFGTDFG